MRKAEESLIRLIDYSPERLDERELESVEEALPAVGRDSVSWINVDGLHDLSVIERCGECFSLHPLTLEDILNTEHRPKCEDYDSYLFMVLKMLSLDEETGRIAVEQTSLVLGANFVLSFQEQPGDVFDGVRQRIRGAKGRIRKSGSDYLAYALLDVLVDSYFVILERIGDRIEELEEELLTEPKTDTLEKIHVFRRDMIVLRKSIWPLREVISSLERHESKLIDKSTGIFLRDVYDHTIQVVDTVETYRDTIGGMFDLYLSGQSNRMNEVMKLLTIMATIFIPLTFIAGVYGMNFQYMPELSWRWGYPAALLAMLAIGVGLLVFFRKKKWL